MQVHLCLTATLSSKHTHAHARTHTGVCVCVFIQGQNMFIIKLCEGHLLYIWGNKIPSRSAFSEFTLTIYCQNGKHYSQVHNFIFESSLE